MSTSHVPDGVRLQKVLATAGFGSRRFCEHLIKTGRVRIDGTVVRELGIRVDPQRVVLHVDGKRVQLDTTLVTVAVNKPAGMVTTMDDPHGRPTVASLVTAWPERLFHVGRLDADTEGLLLMTNDGELANRLTHPSYEVPKTYRAIITGKIRSSTLRQIQNGVTLDDGSLKVDAIKVIDSLPDASLVEVTLHEGRNRIVRRLFEHVGHPVTRLVRTQIGPVRLGNLRPGTARELSRDELGRLMAAVGM